MSLDGIIGSGNAAALRGADAVPRAGGVLSSLAARQRHAPLDAFQIAGRGSSSRAQTPADQPPGDGASASTTPRTADGSPQSPNRTVTAFVTQSLAQEQEQAAGASSPPQASQITAGLRAYARSVGATVSQGDANIEVIPPQLSSGHSLDLAV